MNLDDVHRPVAKHRRRRRIGRGTGSGRGKTAARGHKGQGSRSGFSQHPTFQGGTMPLVRRVAKRGFHNRFGVAVAAVNVAQLQAAFEDGETVDVKSLSEKNLARGKFDLLKILGSGDLTKKLTVSAHRFSRTAVEKIEKAGGKAVALPGKKPVVKNKQRA